MLGWVGLWFILGVIEAWFRFRRLMIGWQTHRGLPVCWVFIIFPVTLLLLFFFRKGYRARTQAEATELKKEWKAMSVGKKLRLFVLWGFRYKYPPMLGPAPARVKMSKKPTDNPRPHLLHSTPPHTVAPNSHPGSDRSVGGANPEVSEVSSPSPHPSAGPLQLSISEVSGLESSPNDEIGRAG